MGKLIQTEHILVLCTVPDPVQAEQLAQALVQKQLAACVTILRSAISFYQWEDSLQRTEETQALIKTTQACYPALQEAILQQHAYQVPEIIAIPIIAGLAPYLAWITQATVAPHP